VRAISICLLALLLAGCNRHLGSKPPAVGEAAPQFTIADSGRTVSLSQFHGHVVVLNFWATWCPPCLEELPSFVEMSEKAQQRGVVVLAVSEDERESDYRNFLDQHHLDMLTVRDRRRSAAPLYGTFSYPETYIIDPNGIIQRKFVGPTDWTKPEILESLVRLQQETPGPSRAAQ
jgi:peroxiredoxin